MWLTARLACLLLNKSYDHLKGCQFPYRKRKNVRSFVSDDIWFAEYNTGYHGVPKNILNYSINSQIVPYIKYYLPVWGIVERVILR